MTGQPRERRRGDRVGQPTYTAEQIAEAVERIMRESGDPAEVWHRVSRELPGVDVDDVLIAGRLQQARLLLADGKWSAAAKCAEQLASDLTGFENLPPLEAWAFLRGLDHPLVAELVRLFDEVPQP